MTFDFDSDSFDCIYKEEGPPRKNWHTKLPVRPYLPWTCELGIPDMPMPTYAKITSGRLGFYGVVKWPLRIRMGWGAKAYPHYRIRMRSADGDLMFDIWRLLYKKPLQKARGSWVTVNTINFEKEVRQGRRNEVTALWNR